MPELPEVETLCRQLHARISGRKILTVTVYDEKLAGIENVRARIVRKVYRCGKTITVMLDDGRSISIHLRMTGRLFWNQTTAEQPWCRWRMSFAEGNVDLIDPRRFATVRVEKARPEIDSRDLMKNFDERVFMEKQAKRKVSIKTLLMDPKAVEGIGNIYACEILHRAEICPLRQAETLSHGEWKKLFRLSRRILTKGIEKRGTSISDWRDLDGCRGENQNELKAYGREGKTCCTCGGIIARIKQGGRSTYYCHQCQK